MLCSVCVYVCVCVCVCVPYLISNEYENQKKKKFKTAIGFQISCSIAEMSLHEIINHHFIQRRSEGGRWPAIFVLGA